MMVLYNDDGKAVTTHSMIKTMRRCPKQTQYKYADRLKPRMSGRPLTLGKWMHWLLEGYYKGEDWKEIHKDLTNKYGELFDEEKEKLGDLPTDCYNLMISYLWHYKFENWKVHEVEFMVECEWPDGGLYRGKVDMLVEDDFGLWIVDHKNHKTLPSGSYQLRDSQSALYVWAARKMGIPVNGFIWNYLKTAPPSIPKLVKDNSRFYKNMGDTTYMTFVREIKKLGLEKNDPIVAPHLKRLAAERYEPGKVQSSPFFFRSVNERDDETITRIAAEAYRTHRRLHSYPFNQRNSVERVPDRSCDYMCAYQRLCEAELYGGLTNNIMRQDFKTADPMAYYNDERELGE